MKRIYYYSAILIALSLTSCGQKVNDDKSDSKMVNESKKIDSNITIAGENCDVNLNNVHFTKAINGADTLIEKLPSGEIKFNVGAKKDYFSDPDGKLSNNSAPILLTEIDNKKSFTFVSKVTPNFTKSGLYNAGVVYVYANESLYQKHCFEQDERGNHRVVTVRTNGTSDDSNHDIINQPFVYLKISSDTKTIASYYSLDNKTWHMVRLYKNEYPDQIWVGLSAQCPIENGSFSHFDDFTLEKKSVSDFRLGI